MIITTIIIIIIIIIIIRPNVLRISRLSGS